MGWSSFFRRSGADADPPRQAQEPVDAVEQARTRARRRLIGAVVLLTIGVLGFPLVFETQPRPIPVDIPIEIPKKDGMPPLVMPPVARAAEPASSGVGAADEPVTAAPDRIITETREEAGREVGRPAVPRGSASTEAEAEAGPALPRSIEAPGARAAAKPESKPVAKPDVRTAAIAPDAARAKALLEGRTEVPQAGDPTTARYIVQVGAFTEAGAAQGTRIRLERLGLKTYTQVANTPEGNRIRVRLGPFATREEADRALAKARAAGLGAVIQVL